MKDTEANGDSMSTTYKRGPVLVGSLGSRRVSTRDFDPALAALVGPVQNIFSSPYTIHFFCPHRPASWAGSHAGSPVSSYVSLRATYSLNATKHIF